MENNKFTYTYSAPTEAQRREIESIRRQYKSETSAESNIERLRKLHSAVTGPATALSLGVGILGILIFGLGLTCVLEFDKIVLGIILSILGAPPIAFAYPVYNTMIRRGKKKYGEEIVRLSDEILGE